MAAIQEVDEGIFARMGIGALAGVAGVLITSIFLGTQAIAHVTLFAALATTLSVIVLVGLSHQKLGYEDRNRA
jgi:hypothetical protein